MKSTANEAMSTPGTMDESMVTVVLKEEPSDHLMSPEYIEEICSSNLEKVFLPVETHEVDFTDEMVKLDLEGQNPHHNWIPQTASTSSASALRSYYIHCEESAEKRGERDDEKPGQITVPATNIEEALRHEGYPAINQTPKFYKIQCSICKKWFLNNDSMITHLRSHSISYHCQICQQTFIDGQTLQNHMLSHVESTTRSTTPSLECGICNKTFCYKYCLRNHLQAHVAQKLTEACACCGHNLSPSENHEQAQCEVCRLKCRGKSSQKNSKFHLKTKMSSLCPQTDSELKSLRCSLCERSFAQRTALNNHMLSHSGEKPHACGICEKTYKRKSELIRHTMVHTGERPYECKECLMTFREKAKLNSHMLVHTGEKPHECHICHKACARKSDLNSHMLSHTGGQYDCKICEKIFTRKSDLSRHVLIHTGEKPFACDLCDMAFRERTRLNSHMAMHTGDKRHICHICSKGFRDKSSLKKHMIVHTGDRPYECFICKKTFTQKTTLNSHVQVHSGERPFECGSCPKAFADNTALREHWLVHVSEREGNEETKKIDDTGPGDFSDTAQSNA